MMTAEQTNNTFCTDQNNRLVFVNDYLSLDDSQIDDLPEDVIISDIKTAQTNYADLFKRLNLELTSLAGLFCYVPKNTQVAGLLQLLFNGEKEADLTHLIYLEEGACLQLLEEYRSTGAKHRAKHIIYLEANAKLDYYKLQQESAEVVHSAEFEITQARDSDFKSTVVSLGAKTSLDQLRLELNGANASCELRAFVYAKTKQVIAHHVQVEHTSPHCTSKQVYKTIAADSAKTVFKGRVVVQKDAQKTAAQQSNQNLLLSSKAEVDAKPELEIYADDVKCSHGSTVGQLDQNALFYMRSRGLPLAQAQHIMTCAFAVEILDNMANPNLQHYFKEAIVNSLSNAECCGGCQND